MTLKPTKSDSNGVHPISRRRFLGTAASTGLAFGSLRAFGLLGGRRGPAVGDQSSTAAEVSISVLSNVVGQIGQEFCGLSYEKSAVSQPIFTGDNQNLIGLCRRLGSGILRIGGNQVDRVLWDRSGSGRTEGKVAPPDVDEIAAFARAAGWRVLYGVNLAQSTPALAADEVAYVSRALGANLFGIEIGNEPDNFVNLKYFPSGWVYADYLKRWRGFANAILAQTPDVVLTGPATGYRLDWFKSFATDAPKQVRLLTHHYYRANGQLPTSDIPHLVSYPDTNLVTQIRQIHNSAAAANLPFRFAETNSYFNGGKSNVSNSYASALWVIDHLFTLAANGCEGANFHGGGNSPGYTPIADTRGKIIGARPVYYGMYFFSLAGEGTLLACQCESTDLNLSAYAVETKSGGLNIMAVNKELRSVPVSLDLSGFTGSSSFRSAAVTTMTNASLFATDGTGIGDSAISIAGDIAPRIDKALPVANKQLRFTLPPICATLFKVG